jgi:hypothetical protein
MQPSFVIGYATFAAELISRCPRISECRGSFERGQTSNVSRNELFFSTVDSLPLAVQKVLRKVSCVIVFMTAIDFMITV